MITLKEQPTEAGFRKMMGYDQRAASAAKAASWKFRSTWGIATLEGGVYPVEQIQKAVRAAMEQRAAGRRRSN